MGAMRFGFLLRRNKPEAVETARELSSILAAAGHQCCLCEEPVAPWKGVTLVPRASLGASIDVLVVLGGDGTFLDGAQLVADHGVPLIGINLGSLGFMTQFALPEARVAMAAVVAGELPIAERMRMRVAHISNGVELASQNALNDAAVTQGKQARLLDLTTEVDGEMISAIKADGLVIATPTGSTAYSLAAGGPVVTPGMEALVMTPICPHALTYRSVVLPAAGLIRITNTSEHQALLTVDGQWTRELSPGDQVEIRRASKPLRIFAGPRPFFTVLREKLRWAER
jgi:NAD+ kinase